MSVSESQSDPRLQFDHLGVAVHDLEAAIAFYERAFGHELQSGPYDDPLQQATVAFVGGGPGEQFVIELIAPLGKDSHVARLLEKGVGAYHVCYEVENLDEAIENLRDAGCFTVRPPTPAVAYGGRHIAWLYTPSRQLVELVERSLRG